MRYQETESGIAKFDDSGKLIGVYSKSDPNVKEWRQQQGASQRRSTNRNTSSAVAKNTTTTTKPKYSEPIGPKPQVKSTPTKTTQRPATQIQAQRSNQNAGYQNYNRPWEQNLPEYARPGEQRKRLDKAVQPELEKIRNTRDSVERGRREVERVMLRKDRNGLPASTFNERQFHDTSDIIIEMERLKTNPRDYYQKVDELGIDKANEWYRKEKNPYGMKKYDDYSRQADWAEKVSPKEFYKTIGEMAETGTGGNVRQYHEWKNKTGFGDTDNDRMRITLDVGNLSGDKLDKYYEILYNDGLDSASVFAMQRSGYVVPEPEQFDIKAAEKEAERIFKTEGYEKYIEYVNGINNYLQNEYPAEWENKYQQNFADTFSKYINDSVNNSDFDSADFNIRQLIKGSAGKDRKYYQDVLDSVNKYEYEMLTDPDALQKIQKGKKEKDVDLREVAGWFGGSIYSDLEHLPGMKMSEKEENTYNYLKGKSLEAAKEYIKAWYIKNQNKKTEKIVSDSTEFANKYPKTATAMNLFYSLGAGAMSLGGQVSNILNEKISGEYTPSKVLAGNNDLLQTKNAMHQGVLDTIDSPAGKFLYNAGVSTINNVAGVALYNKYYPLIMSLNAAGEETHSGLERGISKDVALLNGAISGGIEYITEKMFFDDVMAAVTKPISKNSQSVIKNLARASIANTGSEFGEEFVGAIAQNITDSILTGDKSKFNAIVNENIANGMSRDEAVQDAFMQSYVWEPLQNGLAGAISGGILGGGYHYNAMTQAGSAVVNSNIGDAILTRALSAPKGTSTHTAAEAIIKKLQNGERVDNYQYGLLKNAMSEDGVRLADADMTPTDKLNNVYLKKGGGVAGTVAASRLSWAQYQYLDEIGRAKGKNIIIKDFIGNDVEVDDGNGGKTKVHFTDADNGYYNAKTGDIYISANSENPLLATARHEIFHPYAQTKAGQEYIDGINNIAKKQNKEAYEAKINGIKRMYENRGSREIGDLAREEFAADAAWKMMSRFTDVVRITNETPSVAQKIKGVVVDLLNTIEGANAKINGVAGSVYDGMTKTQLQDIKRNFDIALGQNIPTISKTETVAPAGVTANPITNTSNIPQTQSAPDITQVLSRNAVKNKIPVQAERNITDVLNNGKTTSDNGTIKNSKGKTVAAVDELGDFKYSHKTFMEGGRDALVKYLNEQVNAVDPEEALSETDARAVIEAIDRIYEICEEYINSGKYVDFSNWSKAEVKLDDNGSPVFSVVRSNNEYPLNIDMSLVCAKRRALDAIFNRMVQKGIINSEGFNFTPEDFAVINQVIKAHGFEIACDMCYVEAKRYRQINVANDFANMYNKLVRETVPKGTPIKYFNFGADETINNPAEGIDTLSEDKLNLKNLQKLASETKKDKKGVDRPVQKVPNKIARYLLQTDENGNHPNLKLLQRGDFMSTRGFEGVAVNAPELLKIYNSKKGTGGPKASFGDMQYINDIIENNKFTKEKAFDLGGVRIQSFSDYMPRLVFDYCQMVAELAAKELPAHAYTKVVLFVKQFGLTGIKINMSAIPKMGDSGIPGLNADGSYAWADESFPFDEAVRIQNAPGYRDNCGIIAVGVCDEHIWKMMADERIRVIIPYHKSGINPAVASVLHINKYTNYEKSQRTARKKGVLYKEGVFENVPNYNKLLREINPETGKLYTPTEASKKYFDYCIDNNITPKFTQFAFLSNGEFNPNYYKVLNDFTTEVGGEVKPQQSVKPIFPNEASPFGSMKDLIQQGLEESKVSEGSIANTKKIDKTVDDIITALENSRDARVEAQKKKNAKTKKKTNKKLSAKENVGAGNVILTNETKDLMAVHNLSVSQLGDVLRRKGSIMPSVAVTNKRHTAFGDATIIFRKETIDPYADENNILFNLDAQTPTQTTLKKNPVFDNNAVTKVLNMVKSTIGNGYNQIFDASSSEFKEAITATGGSIYDALAHNMGIQTAYAVQKKLIRGVPKINGTIDTAVLRNQLDAKLDNDNEWRNFKRWLSAISDTVITSYDTASNEDIFNNMKAQPASTKKFKLAVNGKLTAPATEYDSIEQYKANKHRLSEEAETQAEAVGQSFISWAENIQAPLNDVINTINTTFENRYDTDAIISAFKSNGINITRADAKALQNLYKQATELPTLYFEAKPQRIVGLEEIAMVVIPDNADASVIAMLIENNIPYTTYEHGNEQARMKAINGVEGVKFSNKNQIGQGEANLSEMDAANTNVAGDVEERNITNVLRRKDEKERDITKVLTGRNAELETAVKSKGEYNSDNEIADEDYPDWFFGTPTPTDADSPPVIAQTEAERMLTEMRDAIFKVVGKKITYDNTEIRNIAKNFKKMYNSRASIEKVSTAIAEAYKAVAEVQNAESENIDSDKIKNMIDLSEKAARIIIDSSDSIDRTLWDANKPVRDFIRQNVFRVNESIKKKFPEGGYNSFAEFLKVNRGSIRISYTKGTPVDTLYNELVNNFPEWFTNAPSSAEEQLVWIADVLQDMRSTLVQDESGLTYDDKVQMLGSDILSVYTDAVFDIGTQQNIISEIERRKRDSIKRYYSEKYQEKIERDRERKQASEDRQKLLRIAKWLKNKRTSEYYREQIDELIHNLDTESIGFIKKGYDKVVKNPDGTETVTHVMDRLDIEKLAEEYNKLKEENPNFIVNAAVERKIQRLKNRQISDLSIEEVRDLIDVLSNLQTEIMNSDRLIKSKRAERASKIAHDTKKRLAVIKGTGDSVFKNSLSAFLTGHVGAVAAARKFVGYQKDSSFVAVVEEINDGQRKASKTQQESNAIFDNFLKDEKNRKFLADIDKTYKDYGNGVVITPGMKISLALLSENKNAAEHIQGGGMTIPNPKLLKKGNVKEAFYKGKTIQITQEQLIEIAKDLTPQEKEFADLVKKLMNEYSKKKINETSLELYGYELANVTDYFPIRTDRTFIGTEVENLSQNGTLEGMGILKERQQGAYNPLVLESVIDVVNRHINDVSKFAGLAIPLRNFKLVYGSASYMPTFEFDNRNAEKITDYSSLQHSLTSTWGSHAKEYFDNLIQDIDTGGRKSDKSYSKILDKVTGNIAKQALLTNLSVVMKQIAAYPTAGAVLGFKPLGQALRHHVTSEDKALYNRITPVMWLREKGYSMKEMSDYMDGPSLSKKVPALLGWIQAVDVNIAYKICKAAEMYVNENYDFKKGTTAWEQALADTINKAIEKTQQSSTTMQRAAVLRSPNELVKMFNLFKSQSYLQTELMLDAIGEYNAWREDKKAGRDISDNDIKDSRRRLANVVSAQIVASATMSTIGIIYRAAILGRRDWEDEEKKFSMSKLAEALVTSIIKDAAGMIQYGNEISDFVYSMLTGEKYYGIDVATASLISDAFDGILTITDNAKDIVAVLRGEKQFDINQLLMPTLKSTEKVAAVFGIPMANIRKNVQGVFNLSTAALQKFNPGAAKKIDETVTNFFYGGTAVFDNRKKEIYEQQKQAPKDYEANYERKKYEKANMVVNTLEKFTDTKRSVINKYVNEYNEAIQNMSLSPEAEKVFKKLYSKLYSEYGQTVAKQSLPFYTATQELNVEYGGEKFKYNLNASEYIDYVKKLAKEDLKVFETLAKDEYFLEQSPEVQLKMLKKQRDDAITNFETGIVIDKIGVSADLEAAEKAKIRDKALSMSKTPGKDYIKLGDIYYEVSPETYSKYEKYITAKTQKIIDILKDGTPLNYIDGFEDVYFRDEDGEKIEIDMPLDEYGEIIQGKILDRVKTEVKNSFENELSNQGKTQKIITDEIMNSEYRYYKDDGIVKKIDSGDTSQSAWVRSTDKNIVHEMNEDDYIEEVPIDKSYNIIESARKYIGTPYKWGGTKKETGFDCSGLMQCVFAENGIKINRTAREQFKNGTPVEYNNLKKGDLVFFKGSTGTASAPGHVGLYIGNGQFLHAPQTGETVKISDINKRKDYVGARRIIN